MIKNGVIMSEDTSIDYKKVGLRVGLEIHQQLKSNRKLFCHCKPCLIKEDPDIIVVRYMRPTLGETGEIDPTMLKEFKKKRCIVYQAYRDRTCLYELDETPPYEVDRESLVTSLIIAKLFDMKIPDVLIVSRKQYLDGSVPSGFQRTVVVGLNGRLELSNGKIIGITHLCLEEDAARKISEDNEKVVFRVDRLGIPLVEIGTRPDLNTPEEVLDAALRIGALLRATRRVLRGLGTIRQDINVSIAGGARVEIKGVQRPEWFKPLIDNEIRRQLSLIEISKELKNRGVKADDISKEKPVDVSHIFQKTGAKFIRKALSRGKIVLAIRLPKFGGLLGREIIPGRRFGKEFAERVSVITGLAGIIHTDELPAYGISEEEKKKLFEATGSNPREDAVVFVVGPTPKVYEAIEEVKERAVQALDGVPPETRKANPDGSTSFERPLGTAARLYPDTDSPPIIISEDLLRETEKNLPEYPWKREERYVKELGIHPDYAKRIIASERSELFEELIQLGIPPKLAISVLLDTLTSLRRDSYPVDEIPDKLIFDTFVKYKEGTISKEAIPEILMFLSKNPDKDVNAAIEALKIKKISLEELEKMVDDLIQKNINLIQERKEKAFKPLMGDIMRIVRGKIDGKIVSQVLMRKIKETIEKLDLR